VANVEEILSVGIDIGTSTTSLIISKLKIKNIAGSFNAPKIEIIEKNILYRSDIYFTPLTDEKTIDFIGLKEIIEKEYEKARVNPSEIKTGAVIITGETARKQNAENILDAISKMAGTFVVATAGPNLEAYLAGVGAGAAKLSSEMKNNVCNVDIGGGTTNISVFGEGKLLSTFCANIGGRLIKLLTNCTEIRLKNVSHYGRIILDEMRLVANEGDRVSFDDLQEFARRLAEALLSILIFKPNPLAEKLAIGVLPKEPMKIDVITFSGGVGRLFYEDEYSQDVLLATRFQDVGPLLAFELKKGISKLPYKVVKPSETIYATVIGAGVHTTELSGSTIYISDPKVLPLRNIPVFRIDNPYGSKNEIMEEVRRKMDTFKNAEGQIIPALLIPDLNNAKFDKIKNLAESIFAAYRITNQQGPLIVICEGDLGKALGSVLKNLCGRLYDVISIDEISVKEGDYIDIGEPLYNGSVVPVILKTLVFSH